MRFSELNNYRIRASIAAAGCAVLAGTPVTRGNFEISVFDQLGVSYQGNTYDVYVFAATNDTIGTGTALLAAEVTIDSGDPSTYSSPVNALAVDVEHTGGSGTNARYVANVSGAYVGLAHSVEGPGAEGVFGDPAVGTFIAIGQSPYSPDYIDNDDVSASVTQELLVQGNSVTNKPNGGNVGANASGTLTQIDPAFRNGSSVNSGNINNGTLHSMTIGTIAGGLPPTTSPVPDTADVGAVPFTQVVVTPGTQFTLSGFLAGPFGIHQRFSTVVTAGIPTGGPAIGLNSAPSSSNLIGTVTMVGSDGTTGPQTVSVSGVAQTTGAVVIDGLQATNVYGLEVIGFSSFSQLLSDLTNALQATNPGAIVEAPTGNAGDILTSFGDNVELVLPNTPSIGPTSATITPSDILGNSSGVFSYDLSSYTNNGSPAVTQITVLPEPAGIMTLLIGGGTLLEGGDDYAEDPKIANSRHFDKNIYFFARTQVDSAK